ncbi:hypothetical protein ACH5RR_033930 [Cinchona calisaya]|uniref:SKP1-like protein n=1 Tax=Cinchona calisaya TaxID=153742 RepID=A0ABD2Y9E5_9GENT
MASKGNLTLKSCNGKEFIVEEKVAVMSTTIKNMVDVDDSFAQGVIPIIGVDGKILAKLIEYCKEHAEADEDEEVKSEEYLKKFDEKFVDELNLNDLYDLLKASNYLEITKLLNLLCQKVASMIKGKKPEEIRRIFNIKNDFTPEEEEEINRQNPWAF